MVRYFAAVAIFFTSCFALQAQYIIPDENLVDYSAEELPLRQVLDELGKLSGVTIAFQEEIIPGDSIVSISVRKERLGKVIDYLIKRHGLKYKIVGDQIVIKTDPYLHPQEKVTISGYIRDESSGEPLVNANVYLHDQSEGTIANEYGFYSFKINKGLQRVYFSYLGYKTAVNEFSLTADTTANIYLEPSHQLSEIVITEKRIIPEEMPLTEAASLDILPVDRIHSTMPLGGEPDVMRMAYTRAGVTTGADGFGGMSVRGGDTNQNLILFDGIPVYNSNHAFGLFSIFNASVIKSARLYKGPFPAHYSGRLSSVLDIRSREGNSREFHGDFSLGLLTVKGSVEGPIVKDKSSFLFSMRRTFVDPWIESLTEYINEQNGKQGSSSVYFLDFNGKVNFNIGKRSKLYLSYYSGSDNFNTETIEKNEDNTRENLDETSWFSGNKLAVVRWNFQLSKSSFVNFSAYHSRYSFQSFDHDRINLLEGGNQVDNFYEAGFYQSQITDKGLKMEMDIIPGSRHSIKIGGSYIDHDFSPGLLLVDNFDMLTSGTENITENHLKLLLDEESIKGKEYEFFIEDKIRLGKHTQINLGYNHMIVDASKRFNLSQPRILFATGSDKYTFKLSWGKMAQYLHNLTNSGLGIPVDVWLPSTAKLAPEKAWMAVMGHEFDFEETSIKTGVELFYKEMSDLTRYGENGLLDISSESGWESLVPVGTGKAYGVEYSFSKSTAQTTFSAAYTLSRSTRQFPGINNGESFRFRYDRTHVIHLSLVHKFNPSMEFSANWSYGTGNPVTIANGQNYFYTDEKGKRTLVLIFEKINNDKLPDYHRLDLGLNIYNQHKWGTSRLTLGLYNAYNRKNPFYRDIVALDPDNPDDLKYQQITILPILPTFSYNLSF